MAQFQRPNPWDPNYATPEYVYGEPPGRGTLVTRGLPRGTIDTVNAHQTQANYAVPGYVLSETQGRGAYDTKMLPRRFVDTLVPDRFARPFPNQRGSLSGTVFSNKTLKGSSLGDVAAYGGARHQSPFRLYGIEAAAWIDKNIANNPRLTSAQRERALREVLDKLDSGLRPRIRRRAEGYQLQGVPAVVAFKKAMAEELAQGLVGEVARLGKGKRPKGVLSGLGATTTTTTKVIDVGGMKFTVTVSPNGDMNGKSKAFVISSTVPSKDRLNALRLQLPKIIGDGIIYRYNKQKGMIGGQFPFMTGNSHWPVLGIGDDHAVFTTFYNSAGKVTAYPDEPVKVVLSIGRDNHEDSSIFGELLSIPLKVVSAVVKPVASAASSAVGAASGVVGDALDKLGDLACKAANSQLATTAAGAYGASQGGEAGAQAGVAGAQLAQNLCGGSSGAGVPYVEEKKSLLPWIIAGGGAVLLVLAVKR